MKISATNLGIYSSINSFKSRTLAMPSMQTMGAEDELPNPRLYADVSNWSVPYSKRDALVKEYREKVSNVCFSDSGKIDKRISDYLDNAKFEIEVGNSGEKKQMTIKEAVNASINRLENLDGTLFHATGWREIGEEIIKNGFDPDKISRTNLGPGFYFSGAEGGARMYSNCVLKADCKGTCAMVAPQYYEKIASAQVLTKIANFIGLKSDDYSLMEVERIVTNKVLNEYVRNYFVNELGIDMAFGSSNRAECCYAVYNPDSISNIRFV